MKINFKVLLLSALLFILFMVGFFPFIFIAIMHIMDFGKPSIFMWFIGFMPVVYAYFSIFKKMTAIKINEQEIIEDTYKKGYFGSEIKSIFKDTGKLFLIKLATILFYAFTLKELSESATFGIFEGLMLGFFYFITNLCFVVIIYLIREGRYGRY